jgi:hypothetical protein
MLWLWRWLVLLTLISMSYGTAWRLGEIITLLGSHRG